ncbi:uncharacterized protein TM35_000123310 [Trypanosoma theileri]|uniref:Uncharacterized protein n=1 Tax=Trypanosoma theileri TaxID=67003 RepID=A0A1X0NXY4_9TRYP|nr:uncharacterized protein TM35_000123310 [Trypanosoma theileri]ORC89556.1 hypothetical protein TM35_000123310 [Trypanosoma theileri]
MTTMFVQLRRVVYLLVLLQCCVCVAYAQQSSTGEATETARGLKELEELTTKMKEDKANLNGKLLALRNIKSESPEALKRAKSAASKAWEVEELILPILTPDMLMFENVNKKESKSKELFRKAVDAAKEAKEAAEKAILTAKKSNDLVEEIRKGSEPLMFMAYQVEEVAEKHIEKCETGHSEEDQKEKKLAEEYKKQAKDVESFLQLVDNDIQSNTEVVEEVQKQAKDASDAAASLQKIIDNIFRDHPHIRAELEREIKETPSHENKEVDGSLPNKQNEENTRNQNTNSAQAEAGSHTTAQQQQNEQDSKGQNNKESNVETQEENRNSQSNPPTDSNSSATGTSQSQNMPTNSSTASETPQSQNMPTNSPSSASIHLNITQLSDSSSSPALVHSPLLLLLVLMCVLGCTLVC